MYVGIVAQTVVLTGGTGFLGTHLTQKLMLLGYQVVNVPNDNDTRKALTDPEYSDVFLRRIIDLDPTAIIHLAAHQSSSQTGSDVQKSIQATLTLGTLLIEAARQSGAVFLTTGTYWEFPDGRGNPKVLYAAVKKSFSEIISFYRETHGIPATSLLLYDIYGPNDHRNKIVPLLLSACLTGDEIQLHRKDALINLTFVEDVIEAILLVLRSSFNHTNLVVRGSEFITIEDLVTIVSSETGRAINHRYSDERSLHLMTQPWIFGEPVPGWHPKTSLSQGIYRCWAAQTVSSE